MNTIDRKLNDGIFDAMMKVACEEVMDEKIKAWEEANVVEHEFSPEFERKMQKLLRSQTRRSKVIKIRKALSRVAVVIIAVMAAGFTITMSAEALRVQFFNTVSDFAEEYIGFSFRQQVDPPAVVDGIVYPTYIPEGFWKDDSQDISDTIRVVYRNEDGQRIMIRQYTMSEGMNVQIDGENIGSSYIVEINEISLHIYEGNNDDDGNYVIWDDGLNFYQITGNVHVTELVEIAKSIIS